MYKLLFSTTTKDKRIQKTLLQCVASSCSAAAYKQNEEEKYATIALLNDDLKNREHKNVGLQGELKAKDQQIAALQRRYVDYLLDEEKNNGISIIVKNNEEAEYQHISICGPHDYRRQKVRVLLPRNQGSTLFGDEDECYCYV